jgi:pimeloyl-ACP methyl ester carboxylesterase
MRRWRTPPPVRSLSVATGSEAVEGNWPMTSATPSGALRLLGAGMVALGSVGAAVQAAATRRDRRAFPAPGRMIDVGGHRLHLDVRGTDQGAPTVVLEAGLGSFSSNWHWVHQELAGTTRVVAYDRAGLGWSDRGPRPRDARRIATELHTALKRAGLQPPYLLVGHSFGGLPVRMFADCYRDEVAGMVLADASHPDQWVRWPIRHADLLLLVSQRLTAVLAWLGLLRLFDLSAPTSNGLPERQVAELRARSAVPRTAETEADQIASWRTSTRAQVNRAGDLSPLPLFVLGVSEQPRGAQTLTALQAELPGLSTNSAFRIVQGATHESLIARREHAGAVVEAVLETLESARTGQPLADPRRAAVR